jgi:hypothetical protein
MNLKQRKELTKKLKRNVNEKERMETLIDNLMIVVAVHVITSSTEELCIVSTECIYVFRMILRLKNYYFPKQHEPMDVCDGDVVCFQ